MGVPPCGRCGAPDFPYHACVPLPRAPLPPQDGLSFSERYHGTEWVTSKAAPAQLPGGDRGRSPGKSLLLVMGVACVSVAALIGLVGLVLVGLRPAPGVREGLNAAYAATYSPRPSLPRPSQPTAATQVPESTLQAPTEEVPTSSFDPAPLPDDPLMAFAERVHRADASYAVRSSGAVQIGGARTDFESEMVVDGLDRSGSYTFSVAGLRATTDMVVKDGVGYLRPKGEGWTREVSPSGMPGDFLQGFTGADVAMLTHVGVERRNGRTLHHLRLPKIDWNTLRGLVGESSAGDFYEVKLDIWVTATGIPVKATFTIDATYLEDGVEVDLTADLQYRFTEYGEPHPVHAPEHFEDGDGSSGVNS